MKKKKTTLQIDTRDSEKTAVSLVIDGKKFEEISSKKKAKSQALLLLLTKLLKEHKLAIADLSQVKVETGPGSFTGLRVGISVANCLGWLLNIPVNGEKGKIVTPTYS